MTTQYELIHSLREALNNMRPAGSMITTECLNGLIDAALALPVPETPQPGTALTALLKAREFVADELGTRENCWTGPNESLQEYVGSARSTLEALDAALAAVPEPSTPAPTPEKEWGVKYTFVGRKGEPEVRMTAVGPDQLSCAMFVDMLRKSPELYSDISYIVRTKGIAPGPWVPEPTLKVEPIEKEQS